jgi:hypothetical protein
MGLNGFAGPLSVSDFEQNRLIERSGSFGSRGDFSIIEIIVTTT